MIADIKLQSTPDLTYAFDFDVKSKDIGAMIEWLECNAKDNSSMFIILNHIRDSKKMFNMTVQYSGEHAQENAAKFKLFWVE
jgi:hypothetical protein